jgi:hypothetical protein
VGCNAVLSGTGVAYDSDTGSTGAGDCGKNITGCPVINGFTTTAIIKTITIAAKMTITSLFSIMQPSSDTT